MGTYTTKSQYDNAGRLSAIAYPDDPDVYSVNYEYNGPALKRVYEGAITHIQYDGYNAIGQPETATYGNGVTTTYTYYNSGNSNRPQDNYRLCKQQTVKGSTVYQLLRYSYYNVGNIHEIFDNFDSNNNQTFGYDELNRLTSAQAAAYGTISYSYNEIGNMMSNSQVGSYDYPTNGIRPHAVTTAGSNTYMYDDNGNMTSGAGRTIRYDYDNRPVSVTAGGSTTTFMYDANGTRVKKTANSIATIYIGKLYENTQDGCIKYIFAGDQRIAMRDATGALFYYHTDPLGSSSVITNASGNMVEQLAYFPYGQIRINTGTKDVHYKFTGQELDAETGLYFYGARYYDPQLGRFISADTIVPNPRNPQDMNRYSYVSNNPLNYIDPTGHSKFSRWLDKQDAKFRKFLDRNNINVSAGIDGSVDTGGNITPQGYNPYTGETFPYMPSSAAEVKTASMRIEVNTVTLSTENKQYAEAYSSDAQFISALDLEGQCPDVPLSPQGADINKNIDEAKKHWNPIWFYNQVRLYGHWDYKQQGRQYQDFGNFNYGATGTAFGFPENILLRAAGWAHQRTPVNSRTEFGSWWGRAPYGDDPVDQWMVLMGLLIAAAM